MDMYDVGNKNFSPAMNKLWYCPPVRHGRASPGFVGSVPNDHFFHVLVHPSSGVCLVLCHGDVHVS